MATPPVIDVEALPTREASLARFAAFGREMSDRVFDGSLAAWWADRVARTPDNVALESDERRLTYRELDALVDRVGRTLARRGLGHGDVVALQLPSSGAFLALILGAARLGLRIALLSPNLRGRSLRHALGEVPPRLIVTTPAGEAAIDALDEEVPAPRVTLRAAEADLASPSDSGLGALESWVGRSEVETDASAPAFAGPTQDPDETLFYIFTSGTTGLPKATQCSHRRYVAGGVSEGVLFAMVESDCMYVFLPMFHIAALSSIGAALSVGARVVIRPRFSASRFWDDVRRFSATQFQYLGEIIRYLLAQPERDSDRVNSLKAILGAGLTLTNWRAFDARFGPLRVVESYGSSEGVIGIFNLDGVAGSVGRPPPPTAERLRLVEYDRARDALRRDTEGRLVACRAGEVGELIARLDDRSQFEGYSSEEATRSKLLEGAFEDGDLWYRSGDLFRTFEDYYFFVARIGDTYRWKGENVSTTEVANAIEDCAFVASATVYPVEVRGHEGAAGMALVALGADHAFSGEALFDALAADLPPHAFPLFVRVGDGRSALTETYKLGLATLKADGYSPDRVDDPLFVLDAAARRYVPLTAASLEALRLPAFEPAPSTPKEEHS